MTECTTHTCPSCGDVHLPLTQPQPDDAATHCGDPEPHEPHDDELALYIFQRDGGCLAVTVGGQDPATCRGRLQADHVKDQPPIGAPIVKRGPERKHRYRAPSDRWHLVAVCEHHHVFGGWATANRAALRDYLADKEGART